MVIAGPGSGKTFTIVQRILSLICDHHISPSNILVITYTKAAAAEMKDRFEKAYTGGGSVNFGTFHSICYHILKQSGKIKENSLIKESEKRKLLQVILGTIGLASQSGYDEVTQVINAISKNKNRFSPPRKEGERKEGLQKEGLQREGQQREGEQKEEEASPYAASQSRISRQELTAIEREYERHLREQGMIDFDDMILLCLRLFSQDENCLGTYRKLFHYILVDEFQDINPPQYEILKLLAHPRNNLFVVGDDDQAIYGFRGASPKIMKQFSEDFTGAKQIMLTENYRCGAPIVRLAAEMIGQNSQRFSKEFYPIQPEGKVVFTCFDSHREQERGMAEILSALREEELLDSAVIVRTNREAALYAGYLREAEVAVKGSRIKEGDIYHGFIMEDMLSFLCYLYEGKRRGDFIGFMNKPNRFLTRKALPQERVSINALERYYEKNPQMLGMVRHFFRQLAIAEGLTPYLAVSFFRKSLCYNEYLRIRAGEEREYRRLCTLADQVQQCFKDCRPGAPVRAFVEQKALKEEAHLPQRQEEGGVHILTMHGAKGLEFDRVFLPDLNEGVIPGKDCMTPEALEEERRLLYVAVTRAKKELYLYCCKERGRKPSRYLEGLSLNGRHGPSSDG